MGTNEDLTNERLFESKTEKANKEEKQIVVFKIGTEEFGVSIYEVRDIIRMEKITKIPNTKPYIKGVINLRGSIIVVIDLAMKLGFPTKATDINTRIINIDIGKNVIGMVVDSATEVMRIKSDHIEPAPEIITQKINADYINGVGIINDRLLILLDLQKVLESDDFSQVKKISDIGAKVLPNDNDNSNHETNGKANNDAKDTQEGVTENAHDGAKDIPDGANESGSDSANGVASSSANEDASDGANEDSNGEANKKVEDVAEGHGDENLKHANSGEGKPNEHNNSHEEPESASKPHE